MSCNTVAPDSFALTSRRRGVMVDRVPAARRTREERSDGDLVREIATLPLGEGSDLEAELVSRFSRRVYLFGLRNLRDQDLAADLSQDVMARVIERVRAGEVRNPERIGSFVLGTARLMAHDERRRARRRDDLAARVEVERAGDHATLREAGADLDRLQQCLERLGERERSVVMLTFCAGQDANEIAESVAISTGNVRVVRHRAIAQLKDCMGLDLHGGQGAS